MARTTWWAYGHTCMKCERPLMPLWMDAETRPSHVFVTGPEAGGAARIQSACPHCHHENLWTPEEMQLFRVERVLDG